MARLSSPETVHYQSPIGAEKDEHPRGTALEAFAKLPTPFKKEGGTVTAGNASGVNDGAVALVIASEAAVKKHGLPPSSRILGGAVAGVPPRIMGIGPVYATRRLCARLDLKLSDFDGIELNEAFASQGPATLRELGIADDAEEDSAMAVILGLETVVHASAAA
jgi:acetyl-CoA acetyltransferase